jgi:beta-lactamase class A
MVSRARRTSIATLSEARLIGAMRCTIPAFFVMLVATPHQLPAQDASQALRERILRRIAEVTEATVAVAYHDIGGGALAYVNPDSGFHAASTMKVPVLIEYFRAIDDGRLRAGQDLLLVNAFASIVDRSPYSLNARDDSDSSLYAMTGRRVPLRDLAERMITKSSNLATNVLIEVVGARNADSTARALGARNTKVLRGVEDARAYEAGLSNVTTARDLAVLLEAIEINRAASPAGCREMLGILSRQEHNGEIPAGLPPGTRVAHKTGWITGVLHDAALVYPPGRRPYVLVVLTKGIRDREVARSLIADISRMVWERATAP